MTSLLEQNLRQLAFIDADLAERMRVLPTPPTVKVVPTRSNFPSAVAITADGVEAAIHSLQDPLKQSRRFVDALEIREDVDAFAVIGCGLGYHVHDLIRRLDPDKHVLVIESREDVFRAALECRDLGFLLGRKNVRVFVGTDYIGFLDWLKEFLNASNADSLSVIRHIESYRLNPAFYGEISLEMEKAVSRRRVELNTLVQFGPELETNVIRNLPDIVSAFGVNRFTGAFKGVPAVLVGAGPSLSAALPLLREIQDRAVIVVADTATKLLLREGIRPHFTALLDMTDKTAKFFKDLRAEEAPIVIFDPDAYHGTVHDYPGRRLTFESVVPWTQWAVSVGETKGAMEKGISVVHTGYLFLREAGADPIIFTGIDLGFPGKTTHAEGVVLGWGTGAVTDDMDHQLMLPSVTGGQVKSVIAFKTFVTVFEILISQTKAKIVNTTPEGALIRGAENLPLDEALRRYVTAPNDIGRLIEERMADPPRIDWTRFRERAAELVDAAVRIDDLCESAMRWLKQTARLDRSNKVESAEWRQIARKINRNRIAILSMNQVLPLFQRAISGDALEVRKLGKAMEAAGEGPEREKLEQERMRRFFGAYQKAAAHLKLQLDVMLREAPR